MGRYVFVAHEMITVGNRQWCLGCDLSQTRKSSDAQAQWRPLGSAHCHRTTPWAAERDKNIVRLPQHTEDTQP